MKTFEDFKRPKTFNQAVKFFDFITRHGHAGAWSIQYWGFGEHFTFWAGFGTFIDFGVDQNTPITWDKMKEIIIESAQDLYDEILYFEIQRFERKKKRK